MTLKYVYVLDDKNMPEVASHVTVMQNTATVIPRFEFAEHVVEASLYELEARLGIVGLAVDHKYWKSKFMGRPCLYFENDGYSYVFLNNARRNRRRAEAALECIKVYSGYDPEDIKSCLVDFLDDIMHLCDEKDVDFYTCMISAAKHFDAEMNPDDIEAGSLMEEVCKEL
jgi:hypothetical protein